MQQAFPPLRQIFLPETAKIFLDEYCFLLSITPVKLIIVTKLKKIVIIDVLLKQERPSFDISQKIKVKFKMVEQGQYIIVTHA